MFNIHRLNKIEHIEQITNKYKKNRGKHIMLIRNDRQLSPGQTIKWDIITEDAEVRLGRRVGRTVDIEVIEVYSHHVLFRILEPPFLKLDIQNVELLQHGVYKREDMANPFVRCDE